MLARLVYYSENHLGACGGKMLSDLNTIMDTSNRNNQRDGLTGALLFDSLWFIQILEGEREAVSRTLARIAGDDRHANVTIMDCRPIEERLFGNWWMGVAVLRDDSALYTRLGMGQRLTPSTMTGDQTVMLALDLASAGLERRVKEAA